MKIELTQGKFAIIDDKYVEEVLAHRWYAKKSNGGWYARRNVYRSDGKQTALYLHKFIADLAGITGPTIDHINRNTLDCRVCNLRGATQQGQSRNRGRRSDNTSGYIGVSRHGKGWQSYVKIDGKRIHLGTFASKIEAARARDEFVREHFGEFAVLNFPD